MSLRARRAIQRRTAVLLLSLLAGLLALRIYWWGRPVPRLFQPAGPNQWRSADGRQIEARDLDGDGTYDRFSYSGGSFPRPTAGAAGSRLLIVCLDGVPFSAMSELWQQGHFREFFPPVELVSTFPSESEVALTAFLQAPPSRGYENLYFDRGKGRITGGITVTLAQSAPYLKKFHYDEPALFKGVHFILPVKSLRADLGRLRKRFLASSEPVYVAHTSSTDGLYHVSRSGQTRPLMMEVESLVRDLYLAAEGKLRILLFSDHGNNLAPGRAARLVPALESAGFQVKDRLGGPRVVILPRFGLVSFAAVFAQRAVVPEVARVLAATEGVDAVVYRERGALRVHSRNGQATVESDPAGTRFRYRTERGDPLRLLPVWERLRSEGKLDAAGFAPEPDLFAATVGGPFPDALFRLWESSLVEGRGFVENRADLLVSLADGYYNGSGFFQRLVDFQSTHGGLGRGSTTGFAMTTDAPFPRALRYNELLTSPSFSLPRGTPPAPGAP